MIGAMKQSNQYTEQETQDHTHDSKKYKGCLYIVMNFGWERNGLVSVQAVLLEEPEHSIADEVDGNRVEEDSNQEEQNVGSSDGVFVWRDVVDHGRRVVADADVEVSLLSGAVRGATRGEIVAPDLGPREEDEGEDVAPDGEDGVVVQEVQAAGDVPEVVEGDDLGVEGPVLVVQEGSSIGGGDAKEGVADDVDVEGEVRDENHAEGHAHERGEVQPQSNSAVEEGEMAVPQRLVESALAVVVNLLVDQVDVGADHERSNDTGSEDIVEWRGILVEDEETEGEDGQKEDVGGDEDDPEAAALHDFGLLRFEIDLKTSVLIYRDIHVGGFLLRVHDLGRRGSVF